MWNDNDTDVDLIDFDHLVFGVTNIIKNENLMPCTIGVFGDWGSGKSSLLKMVESRIADENTLVVKFNGWLFEGYDDAKASLMTAIIESVVSRKTLTTKAKEVAKRLFEQVDVLKTAKYLTAHSIAYLTTGGLGNVAIEMHRLSKEEKPEDGADKADRYEDLINKLSQKTSDRSFQMGIREFHSNFESLLKETDVKKLIVLIDDLDRCNSDTVISVLEAIKLFLFVKNSAFIIAADERLIKYAVRRRFPEIPGDNSEVGRDYLEKLIQFPIRIPQLSEVEIETYINLLFTKLRISNDSNFDDVRLKVIGRKNSSAFSSVYNIQNLESTLGSISKPPELEDDFLLSSQVTPILAKGLNGNPRQCKRFLNTLLMRIAMANNKGVGLSKRIMAKLMLLEYFRPETFRAISESQSYQNGQSREIVYAEQKLNSKSSNGKEPEPNDLIKDLEKDSWLASWLKTEPQFAGTDLRPYFFFSRDNLKTLSIERARISSEGQDVLGQLLSTSAAIRTNGFKNLQKLSSVDVATIFSILANKVRQEEDGSARSELIKTVCKLSENRGELINEFLLFMKSLSPKLLSPSIVPVIKQMIKGNEHKESVDALIKIWSENKENSKLATAAKTIN